MTLSFTVLMAVRALRHNKGRSFLTILGIVIGIAGIISIMAIGSGSQKKAREQILAYGSKSIGVWVGNWAAKNATKDPIVFKMNVIETLLAQCDKIQYITPVGRGDNSEIAYEGNIFSANVIGVNEQNLLIDDLLLAEGSFVNQQHELRKENVVVLDDESRRAIFKSWDSPIGKTIRIKKIPFTVIGVLQAPKIKGKWDHGKLRMYIPFSTCQKFFSYNPNEFYSINLCAFDERDNDEVKRQVKKILRALHKLDENVPDDFTIMDTQMMAEAAEAGAKIIALFALIAASIALLVGGIGVMNIMLVAVSERTKEIGIKLALGARDSIVLRQFLVESVALCFLGGTIGVVLGVSISWLLGKFTKLPAVIEPMPIVMAFIITVLIGLFFGYYPARKASRLDPVEALQES